MKLKFLNTTRTLGELVPADWNPRKLSEKAEKDLRLSLEKFDLAEVPVINTDNMIIAGHQRVKTLLLIYGKDHVIDVRIPNRPLNEKEVREYNIRSNKNTGEWDFDLLAENFDNEDLIGWGFDADDLKFDFDSEEDEEETEEEQHEVEHNITVIGDLYELDDHRLLCGDSTSADDVNKLLDGEVPILMVTDPPYGVKYDPEWRDGQDLGVGERSKGKVLNDDRIDWTDSYSLFPGNVAYVWHAGKYTHQVAAHLADCGYNIISCIVWVKQHFALSRGDYHWQHEPCLYVAKGNHNWQGARDQSTVWEIKNNNSFGNSDAEETFGHGTQKPMECMRRPIINNTAIGDQVYDPFLGSGTTLMAAAETKRICYGMELSPKYCDIIVKRYLKKYPEAVIKRNGEEIDTSEFK